MLKFEMIEIIVIHGQYILVQWLSWIPLNMNIEHVYHYLKHFCNVTIFHFENLMLKMYIETQFLALKFNPRNYFVICYIDNLFSIFLICYIHNLFLIFPLNILFMWSKVSWFCHINVNFPFSKCIIDNFRRISFLHDR